MSARSVGQYFGVDGKQLQHCYKEHLSGYREWEQLPHAEEWVLHPENVSTRLCIDEVALSQGELYTVVSNPSARCQKSSLVALVRGTDAQTVVKVLEKIPLEKRRQVTEVTADLARSMQKAARDVFVNARLVADRFHVQQLPAEALQQMRITHRWQAVEQENEQIAKAKEQGKKYTPKVFENGDTPKQLLARSRYLLFKPSSRWTDSQKARAAVLFKNYPDLHQAYKLTMMFRNIYETAATKTQAQTMLQNWYDKAGNAGFKEFTTAVHSIQHHQDAILNFFKNRSTNALAENLNAKIKAFRAMFRGVSDIPFFIFRLSNIIA